MRFFPSFKARDLRWLDWIVVAGYVAINLFIVFHHEPWRDEAQTWLVARDTGFLGLLREIRYQQGHPPLWYFLLYPFARAGFPYITQAVIHLAVAIGAVWLFVFRSPFPQVMRYAFAFSYFMMFEYAIIARNYSLGVLFLFAIALCYPSRLKQPLLYAGLVFLMFLSTILCFPIGVGLMALFVWEYLDRKKAGLKFWGAASLMLFGAGIAFYCGAILPPDHARYGASVPVEYGAFLVALRKAFIPFTWDIPGGLGQGVAAGIVCAAILSLRKRPVPLLILLAAYAGLAIFFIYFHHGYLRHCGFFLVQLLFVLWIAATGHGSERVSGGQGFRSWISAYRFEKVTVILVSLCLILSVRYTLIHHRAEYRAPFSGSKKMAREIKKALKELHWEKKIVIAHPSPKAASVAAHLSGQERFWYADIQDFGTYWHHRDNPDLDVTLALGEILRRAEGFFGGLSFCLLLLDRPAGFSKAFGYRFRLMHKVRKAVWGNGREVYYLYLVIPSGAR